MSRISEVMKNKNKVEKARRARRKNEMQNLRNRSVFKAKLHDELKHVEAILQSNDIEAIIVTVPDRFTYQFGTAIYAEDLAGYEIEQVDGEPNKFYMRRRVIRF